MKKYHYVYEIKELSTNRLYIGVRSCNVLPMEDIGKTYFSSCTDKSFITRQKENHDDYTYTILKEFNNRKDAIEYEIYLHKLYDVKCNEKYINMCNQTSSGFDSYGRAIVFNEHGKKISISILDDRYVNGSLKPFYKDRVIVYDENLGKNICVSKNDERYLSGELKGATKGRISVIDKCGNTLMVYKNDERYLSGELVGVTKGMMYGKDRQGNKYYISTTDVRVLNGDIIHHSAFWYMINGEVESILSATLKYSISKHIVRNRVLSSNYHDWYKVE